MNSTPFPGGLSAALLALSVSSALAQAASAPAQNSTAVATSAADRVTVANAVESGKLAWYGKKFAGRKTASGETFNPQALTMAHKTLPFGTLVKIADPKNNKSGTVRVNDCGPAQDDRVGDVSVAAARKLGMVRSGVIDAELAVVGTAKASKAQHGAATNRHMSTLDRHNTSSGGTA